MVEQTVPAGQLSEEHTQYLTLTSECSDFLIPEVLLHQAIKDTAWKRYTIIKDFKERRLI